MQIPVGVDVNEEPIPVPFAKSETKVILPSSFIGPNIALAKIELCLSIGRTLFVPFQGELVTSNSNSSEAVPNTVIHYPENTTKIVYCVGFSRNCTCAIFKG